MSKTSQVILIVEDSPEDFEATARSLRKAKLANTIYHCEDGDEALDYLYQRGAYENPTAAPRPGLILLDLELPGTDGREVLSQIKQDDQLQTIPVIVLASSDDQKDVQRYYAAGANSYVRKPVDLTGFVNALQRLAGFQFEITITPNTAAAS